MPRMAVKADTHREYTCIACDARYATPSAAETCEQQDEYEDRATRRIYRSSN